MKLTIVGGGGFRVPLVYRALLHDELIDEVVLYDEDVARLDVIGNVLQGLAVGHPHAPRITMGTDLRTSLTGADFVFAAIRVGGLQGREYDENIPLSHGVLGQETVGLGGIFYALRSIPVMREIAAITAEVAPNAWFINFTNPAGMVTEALQPILGNRVIGICDSPSSMIRRVGRLLDVTDPGSFDYVGLNHMGWLRGVYDANNTDLLPSLISDPQKLNSFEEGQLFGVPLLQALRTIPNEYLHYFYYSAEVVQQLASETTRATYLKNQQEAFYDEAQRSPGQSTTIWADAVDERNRTYMAGSREAAGIGERADEDVEGGGYEQIALDVMRAIATDVPTTLILNVPNGSTYAELDSDAVIEVPAQVGGKGATPLNSRKPLSDHEAGLIRTIKAVERATINAAVNGDRHSLDAALAMHPLSGSFPAAQGIFTEWVSHFPDINAKLS